MEENTNNKDTKELSTEDNIIIGCWKFVLFCFIAVVVFFISFAIFCAATKC